MGWENRHKNCQLFIVDPMRILFLSDNFPPENNAPSYRTYEHCKEWVNKGSAVTVITCFPNFPNGKIFKGYKNKFYEKEVIDGINVIRIWTYISKNQGFLKRTLDYMSFSVMSFIFGLFQKCDIIIGTSPQFFTVISASFLGFVKRKPWVFEVRDLWPESIVSVGMLNKKDIIYRLLEIIELLLYKSAKKIIVVTNSFKKVIEKKGIKSYKIEVVTNGVIFEKFKPRKKNNKLLSDLNLNQKIIVSYIGTHGMAHALNFILRCAKKIDLINIHFLFVGDGAEKNNLLKLKDELKLTNVTFLPSVSKSKINDYISITDISLINLKKDKNFETVIPSKIFENASMKKPILLGLEGEAKKIIESYNAGIAFLPEDEKSFIHSLKCIIVKDNYSKFQLGCEKLAKDFDRKSLAIKMYKSLIACFN